MEYINGVVAQIEAFRGRKRKLSDDNEGEDDSMELPRSNPFQRRLVFQTVRERFTDLFAESVQSSTEKGSPRVIRLTKTTGKFAQ